MKLKLFSFSGSTRQESLNQKLASCASVIARARNAEVLDLNLKDYSLPLYDGDLEAQKGLPVQLPALQTIFKAHSAYIIACPEYNGSFTPLLKNTLDWLSRDQAPASFQNKVVLLLSASPGNLGGLRAVAHVRAVLSQLGALVVPQNFALPKAHEAFDAEGNLKDPKTREALQKSVDAFLDIAHKMQRP